MKILWVSHHLPYPPKAGVLLRSHHLLKELSSYHHVDLIAFNQRGLIEPYFENYESGVHEARAFLENTCQRVEIFDCPTDASPYKKLFCAITSLVSKHPYTVKWLASKQFGERLIELHKLEKYDLIHFDTIGLMPYLTKELMSAAISLDHHNVESHMLMRRGDLERNWLKKIYYYQEGVRVKHLERKYCNIVDINITCSDLDSNRFMEFITAKNFVAIPNGVDVDFFRPSTVEPCTNTLIFIGTLDWYPNMRAVRFLSHELWKQLKTALPDIRIDVIGSRPPEDVVAFASKNKDFIVHGFVDDIFSFLDSANIYVCPINDGGGTKLKVLDAFASGKAVIADPIACEGLNVTDGENVIYASTVNEYIEKITLLCSNPQLRRKIEKNARDHVVKHFSFKSIGKNLSEHYELIVQTKIKRETECVE